MKRIGSIVSITVASMLLLAGILVSLRAQPAAAEMNRVDLLPQADASASQLNDFATCESDGGITTPDPEQASGAKYRICMPSVWTGDLLIYAHGYRWAHLPLIVPDDHICIGGETCVHTIANTFGVAFAATSYAKNGLAVIPGVDDVVDLVKIFEAEYGPAKNVYIAGVSEGGIITALAIERHPDIFDAGLAVCGPYGNWVDQINYFGDFRAVIDYYYPNMIEGDPINVPQHYIDGVGGVSWADHYQDVVSPTIFSPSNVYTLSQILIATDAQVGKHIDPTDWANLDSQDPTIQIAVKDGLAYAIYATMEASDFLGGNPFDNIDRIYSGTDDDAGLNAGIQRLAADITATIAMEEYETDGNIQRPLITAHTSRDQQVPQWHEVMYADKILRNPNSQNHLYLDFPMSVDNYGHCILDANGEMLPAFGTMLSMVQSPPAKQPINRDDPVIVDGSELTHFYGVPISQLVAYAFDGMVWNPIPFQIDQRNITGTYVLEDEDINLVDANDEFVFMGFDVGVEANGAQWPNHDGEAEANGRLAVRVVDPLNPTAASWVYLFQSTTLPRTATSYVSWDAGTQMIETISYTAKFGGADDEPNKFLGLADLIINGETVDIIDRQKIRACALGSNCPIILDEELLGNLVTTTIDLPVIGPIRALTNDSLALNIAMYANQIEFVISFDTSEFGLSMNWLQTTFDLNDPAVTGYNQYFDSNNAGPITVDGITDTVVIDPGMDWMQIINPTDGGGFVLSMPSVEAGDVASLESVYVDNGTGCDPTLYGVQSYADTGDGACYGESGLRIYNPDYVVDFSINASILSKNVDTNVGSAYFERSTTPLIGATRIELNDHAHSYLPFVWK